MVSLHGQTTSSYMTKNQPEKGPNAHTNNLVDPYYDEIDDCSPRTDSYDASDSGYC